MKMSKDPINIQRIVTSLINTNMAIMELMKNKTNEVSSEPHMEYKCTTNVANTILENINHNVFGDSDDKAKIIYGCIRLINCDLLKPVYNICLN